MTSEAAVILAAGKGERLGGRKPLARIAGLTLLERVAQAFAAAGVARLVCVTGAYGEEVAAHARLLGLEIVHNARFEEGMFSSVCAGLAAVVDGMAEAGCVFLHPVDTPLVRAGSIAALLQARRQAPQPSRILLPHHAGQPGHPPLLGRAHAQAALLWRGERGLGGYIDQAAGVTPVSVADPGVLMDVDTPEDLERAEAYAQQRLQAKPGSFHAADPA